ncbi:MAG: DUF4416 family protein [Chitinispirillaceae bacterium]
MAEVRTVLPVKYFVAVLFREEKFLNEGLRLLEEKWGGFDVNGSDHEFDVTDYYEPEMGKPLYRRLVSFEKLISPVDLVDMKLECNRIEDQLSSDGRRRVNLDAGYLDHNKVLLASAKEAGQKIYLDKGIYADLSGRYRGGRYQPFEWSFPDFRDGRYDEELLRMRSRYLEQIKSYRRGQGE